MVRKKPTSRFRGRSDLFRKRVVISIPPVGVAVIAVAIGGAMISTAIQGRVIAAVGLVLSLVAIGTVIEARFQLRNFRYELQEQFAEALEALVIPDGETDLRASVDDAFTGVENATHRIIRLRKRQNAS